MEMHGTRVSMKLGQETVEDPQFEQREMTELERFHMMTIS
jgi:hypothetical protein